MENERKKIIDTAALMIKSEDPELQSLGWEIIKNIPTEDIRYASVQLEDVDLIH